MRKIILLTFAALTFFGLSSCDSNNSKVKELTNQFVEAVNGKDQATIYDLYSGIKDIQNAKLPAKIVSGEVSVEKDTVGQYIATISNPRQQKLVFKLQGKDTLKIVNSYGILEFDPSATEIAIKTGVPIKQTDDIALSKLLDEEGEYITYLSDIYSNAVAGHLVNEGGTWQAQRVFPYVTVQHSIRNGGTTAIKGTDYNVEFNFYTTSGQGAPLKQVENGVDLQPGEAFSYTLYPGVAYYKYCMAHDFGWTVSFVYKNQSTINSLLKGVKFTGREYEKFLKQKADDEAKAAKTVVGGTKKPAEVPAEVEELIKKFYTDCVFDAKANAEEYCSKDALKKMSEANDMDDGGYATWIFRTGAQDEKEGTSGKSLITGIKAVGSDWYLVSYKDMGWTGSTQVKVSKDKIVDVKPNLMK